MDYKRKASYAFFSLKWRKRGPWDKKRRPKGDPNPQKGPLGDPGILKGTQMGTVLGQWRGLCPHSFCSSVGVLCSARRSTSFRRSKTILGIVFHFVPLFLFWKTAIAAWVGTYASLWLIFERSILQISSITAHKVDFTYRLDPPNLLCVEILHVLRWTKAQDTCKVNLIEISNGFAWFTQTNL